MVDADRLVAVLGRITSRLSILDDYAAQDPAGLLADRVRMGDLKYTFLTCIEACIDAAQHVVAAEGLGTPASNADAFRLLARAGLLEGELAGVLASAVGFRNVLVHGYAEVDEPRVVEHLERRHALRKLVAALTALAEQA
jgi:uncharacterized protein YutE (UPF0331/DUF86 family)